MRPVGRTSTRHRVKATGPAPGRGSVVAVSTSGNQSPRPQPGAPRRTLRPRSSRRSRSRLPARRPGSIARADWRCHPGGPDPGRPREASRQHEIETVAQAERDPFDDRAGEMPLIVREGQPDERATRIGVWVRTALSGQVRQEEQAVAGRLDPGCPLDQGPEVHPGRQGVAIPAQAPGRREHDRHHVPAVGDGVAEGMDDAVRLAERTVRGGEDDAGGPQREGHLAWADDADPDGIRRLVPSSGDDRGPGPEARRVGRSTRPPNRSPPGPRGSVASMSVRCAGRPGSHPTSRERPGRTGSSRPRRPCRGHSRPTTETGRSPWAAGRA